MKQPAPELRGQRRRQLALSAAATCVAVLGSLVLWLASVGLPPVSSGALAPVRFSSTTIAFALPALLSGVLFGRRSPPWGWLPTLALIWVPASELQAAAGFRHAALILASAVGGWLVGASAQTRGRRSWPAAGAASVVVVALALLIGVSDRNWLIEQTLKAARGFGSRPTSVAEMALQVPLPMQSGRAYAHGGIGETSGDQPGSRDSIDLWIDFASFRRRAIDYDAFAERLVGATGYAKSPQSLSEALSVARRFGLPERFLEGPWQDQIETSPAEAWALHTFVSGQQPGTWTKPYVQISNAGVLVQVGKTPH